MSPQPPRVILWDLMDTLVHDPFYTHVPQFLGLEFQDLLKAKHPTAWGEFELGRITEEELFERFYSDGRPFDGPGMKRCMVEACRWIDGMETLLQDLARVPDLSMHLLSNYSCWYRDYVARLGIDRYVHPTFVSCDTGVRKPNPEAFRVPCRTLEVAPAQCIFIDDREKNCEAARAVGLDAIHFEGDVGALRKQLASRRIAPV
jgi:FMN phosphatase YigB (HAD superfamily)